ncbi:MAG: glutathione S-transferase C-terminal domain-containing protein, partial [Pseudomonadota bacterium]
EIKSFGPCMFFFGACEKILLVELTTITCDLFVNAGCPWAYRTVLYRSLKGLKDVISISYTQPAAGKEGWTFGNMPEPLLGARHIHDVYTAADKDFTGRCTVPVLWDKQAETIVNNESADIIRMLNNAFTDQLEDESQDYYPAALAGQIDQWNEEIYANVNNGVYRCGFAQSQEAYDAAFDRLFGSLDKIEQHLANNRYLCGDQITEADWRLFATLVRFDVAYYGQFRCNRNRIAEFENLWPYTRDLYQQPSVAETVDIEAIKGIYYGSRPPGILPKGPDIDFSLPHDREELEG